MSRSSEAFVYPDFAPRMLWISDAKLRREMTPEELAERHRKDRETYRRMRERMTVDPEYRDTKLANARAGTRRYRAKNKDNPKVLERRRETGRASYARRREKISQRRRDSYTGDRAEAIRSRNREWYSRNRERRRTYNKTYRVQNGEVIRARERAHGRLAYAQDPKRHNDYQKRWRTENPEKAHLYVRVSTHKRRVATAGTSFTMEEWLATVEAHGGRCAYCGAEGPLEIEPKVPLSRGGTNDIGNIVPACSRCNRRKRSRTDVEYRAFLAREAQLKGESSESAPDPDGSEPAG